MWNIHNASRSVFAVCFAQGRQADPQHVVVERRRMVFRRDAKWIPRM
jgi:hypothetical protein